MITTSIHKTVQEESGFLANKIRGLLNRGIEPRDITVLLCDYENTAETVAATFAKNNVPVNMDIGMSLLQTPIARYVLDQLLLAHHEKVENYLAVIKSPFVNMSKEELFQIENECIKTNRVPKHDRSLAKAKTVGEFVSRIISQSAMFECLGTHKLLQLLDICKEILPDKKMTAWDFSQLFSALATATKVSAAPTYANRVMLANAAEYQPHFVPYLFVASAREGNFPTATADTDILTVSDIRAMAVTIEPTASRQNARARRHVQNIVESANALHLSHVATTTQGEEARVPEIFDIKQTGEYYSPLHKDNIQNSKNDFTLCRGDYQSPVGTSQEINTKFYATQLALTKLGNRTAFDDQSFYASVLKSVGLEKFKILDLKRNEINLSNGAEFFFCRDGKPHPLSVTRLEKFFECPYKHFLERGLGIRERDRHKIGARVMGSIIHKIAEEATLDIISSQHKPSSKKRNSAEIVKFVLSLKEFSYFALDPINKPLVMALKKEAPTIIAQIQAQIDSSDYKPAFVEKELCGTVDGVRVKGIVDRVDLCDNTGKIIDYKTGSDVAFRLRDLYMGTKLQLPLYLGFLESAGHQKGGAFYFHLKGGLKNITNKSPTACGDPPLHGFDEDVEKITKYSCDIAKEGIKHMRQGVVKKSPASEKACKHCLNRALCFHKEETRGQEIPTRGFKL